MECRLRVLMSGLIVASVAAHAGVNLKNGNFYISYTDFASQAVPDFEVTRTYNSKSTVRGWFGLGWGSVFETRLQVSPGGDAMIYEHGAGSENLFTLAGMEQAAIEEEVALLLGLGDRRRRFATSAARVKERADLLANASSRFARWAEYVRDGEVARSSLRPGVLLVSRESNQTLLRTHDGYLRSAPDEARVDEFDEEGRLVHMRIGRDRSLSIERNSQGQIVALQNGGERLTAVVNASGFVTTLCDARSRCAAYDYQGDQLIRSRDLYGNDYSYRYDRDFNLLEVAYSDATKLSLTYYAANLFTRSAVEPSGRATWYRYGADPGSPNDHYWTEVLNPGAAQPERYEWWTGSTPEGYRFNRRLLVKTADKTIDQRFDDLDRVVEWNEGGRTGRFFYDSRSRVERVEEDGSVTRFEYHPTLNKVSRRARELSSSTFRYDPLGHLVEVEDYPGLLWKLSYDARGRLAAVTGGREAVRLDYAATQPQPRRVEIVGLGALILDGEVARVEGSLHLEPNATLKSGLDECFDPARMLEAREPDGAALEVHHGDGARLLELRARSGGVRIVFDEQGSFARLEVPGVGRLSRDGKGAGL